MTNQRLYGFALVACWLVFLAVCFGVVRAEWIAAVPSIIIIIALRSVLWPDYKRKNKNAR